MQPNEDYSLAKKVSDISEQSTLVWGVSYIALPKGGIWSFVDRKWQIDITDDMAPNIVVMKPTQVGLTTIMTVKALWFVSHIRSRGMITFPRKDDVSDYVASTLDPMIEGSEALYAKMGKTDTVRLKRIGDSFLHIMEASVTPRMLPVDILMNDEIDLSNPDNLEQFVARLDVSAYKYHYRFSTPTVSGYGVDAEYERSDQREWVVKCTYCSKEQVLDWDRHLIVDERDERPYYACEKCSEEFAIDAIINGTWVPMNPESDTHGYHVSHMMLPFTRPVDKLYEESKVMDVRTFYNLRLGRPWRPPSPQARGSASILANKGGCHQQGDAWSGSLRRRAGCVELGVSRPATVKESLWREHMPRSWGVSFSRWRSSVSERPSARRPPKRCLSSPPRTSRRCRKPSAARSWG